MFKEYNIYFLRLIFQRICIQLYNCVYNNSLLEDIVKLLVPKNCNSYLQPHKQTNLRQRMSKKYIVYTCTCTCVYNDVRFIEVHCTLK